MRALYVAEEYEYLLHALSEMRSLLFIHGYKPMSICTWLTVMRGTLYTILPHAVLAISACNKIYHLKKQ